MVQVKSRSCLEDRGFGKRGMTHYLQVIEPPLAAVYRGPMDTSIARHPAGSAASVRRTTYRVCPFCEATCGLAVETEGDCIVSVSTGPGTITRNAGLRASPAAEKANRATAHARLAATDRRRASTAAMTTAGSRPTMVQTPRGLPGAPRFLRAIS